ncbi:hypothetical protein [Streptomyces sp. NPDC001292]|uniref:hypothetical protein n=1 Tax=Streptomyces sp. NPDC001292 TaxID=3364558 RepID=UPI003693F12C
MALLVRAKPLFCGGSAQLRQTEDATPDALALGLFGPDSGAADLTHHTILTIESDPCQEGTSHA